MQVSGHRDLTLLDAIRQNVVPRPPLMVWNDWQVWRRDFGLRPTMAADGEATTSTQESAFHRAVMTELYGDDWALQLVTRGNGDGEPLPAELRPDPASGAADGTAGDAAAAAAAATPAAEAPASPVPTKRVAQEVSPGSGAASEGLRTPSSWDS